MQRICPYLASDDDGRTVVDGFDPAHRCRAVEPSQRVGRTQQSSTCLEASHSSCERYLAVVRERGPAAWPPPAADAMFVQTRLILEVAQPGRLVPGQAVALPGRRWMVGGALATVGIAAVASGLAGGLGLTAGNRSASSPSATAAATTDAAVAPPVGSLSSTSPFTPAPTTSPTPVPASTATPGATPPPSSPTPAEQRTYVVQAGDTLNGIAIRFGTSVAALESANGIGSTDVILVGQVLIIP